MYALGNRVNYVTSATYAIGNRVNYVTSAMCALGNRVNYITSAIYALGNRVNYVTSAMYASGIRANYVTSAMIPGGPIKAFPGLGSRSRQNEAQEIRFKHFLALSPVVDKMDPRRSDLTIFWHWLQKSTKWIPGNQI